MSPSRRRRFQRLALTVLGVLLIVLGASRLRAALGDLFHHDHRHPHVERVEVQHEHRHERGHRHEREHRRERERRVEVISTASRDVLYDETFRVRPGSRLVVDLGSENVVLRTTSGDRARVRVEGRGRDAEREFERRRFSARPDDGGLVVQTDPPRRRSMGRTDAQFQVTVEVPRRFDAVLDLGSGNVQVASLEGDLTVDVGSGNVQVEDVEGGQIVLDTGSGNVRARALRGEVRIDTGSGSVQVDRVDGELAVDTGSGSVSIGEVNGPSVVDTGSGSVEMALRSASQTVVDTGSGGVTLRLPRGAGFDVELDGGSVRIDDALDFSGRRERDEAQGRINGGGPRLVVDTGSGSISLRAR